jgi:hypothetical protein
MTKEELKNAVISAARKTWEQQGAAALAAMGGRVTREEVVEGLLNARELTSNLTPEEAAAYRALPPLIKRAILTLAFPEVLTSNVGELRG